MIAERRPTTTRPHGLVILKSKEADQYISFPEESRGTKAFDSNNWMARLQKNIKPPHLEHKLSKMFVSEDEESKCGDAEEQVPKQEMSRLEEDIRSRLKTESIGKLFRAVEALL